MVLIEAAYLLVVNTVAVIAAAAGGAGSDDPSVWATNALNWVVTKGGAVLALACAAIAIWGAFVFIGGNHRKGFIRIGTGLVGAVVGAWIVSGHAMSFVQSFR